MRPAYAQAVCIAALYIKWNTGCMRFQAVHRREAEQGAFMSQEADQIYACRQVRYPLLLLKSGSKHILTKDRES